ncbi:hypothetical protein C2W44_09620, partial [Escherichia coli]|uniref:hypothetical protein n=1 Tax=Escherichia coli TaxID=562 RepID=UPI000CD2946A
LTDSNTHLKNARHRLNEAPRRGIHQMAQHLTQRLWEQSPHIRLSGQDGKAPALHFRPRSVMAAGDFVLRAMMSFADRSPKQDSLYK